MKQITGLSDREKALVALAAAMGGGCRTCAEKLYPMSQAAGATDAEIGHALFEGIRAREQATSTMKEKAAALLGHAPEEGAAPGCRSELARLAAAVAANSAPDALRYADAARNAGALEAQIEGTMAIARKVRGKAQTFSDRELGADSADGEAPGTGTCSDGCS